MAWQLKASEGYKLSKPISAKITDLLYVDDMKVFGTSAMKMTRVLKTTKESTECMGMQWNEKKCAVTHMKKGTLDQTTSDMKLYESAVIARLKDGEQYKFLGVQENLKQEDKLVLTCAAEVYPKRVSVIWSSPLSDHNRTTAQPVCSAGTGLSNENSEMAHCRFTTARQRDTKDHGGEWRKAPIGVKGVIVPSQKGGRTGSQIC